MEVSKPMLADRVRAATKLIYPGECRERGVTYKGRMTVELCFSVNDGPIQTDNRIVGSMPIMTKSKVCICGCFCTVSPNTAILYL